MKKLLLLLLALFCLGANAQTDPKLGTLTVLDAQTFKPVSNLDFFVSYKRNDIGEIALLTERRANLWKLFDKLPNGLHYWASNDFGQIDLPFFLDIDSVYVVDATGIHPIQGFSLGDITNADNTILLQSGGYALGQVIISATKFEEPANDIAQKVNILNRTTIEFYNRQTTADVLEQTGSVLIQKSQQGGGSPVIRGFEANRVLIVIDGVRLNNAIFRGGHLQNVIRIDNSILDKTEVVFGPGSVMYGSDALGGVMHFFTRNPSFSSTTKAKLTANAYGRYSSINNDGTGHFDFSVGNKKLAFLGGFTYSRFGDLEQGANGFTSLTEPWKRTYFVQRINGVDSLVKNDNPLIQVGSGYTQYDGIAKLLFKQNDKVLHSLNFQFSNTGNVPRYDRLSEGDDTQAPTYAEWYYGPEQRMMLAYKLDLKGSNGHPLYNEAHITAAYQNITESRNSRRFNNARLTERTENLDVITLNADMMKKLGRHEFRYGVDVGLNLVNSTAQRRNVDTGALDSASTRYPNGGSIYNNFALYIAHTWEISKKLTLNDGFRFSSVGLYADFIPTSFYPFPFTSINQNNNAFNGNIGLVYKPGRQFKLSVLGSSGFRAPNVDDLAKVFESQPGTVIVPNPDLRPEYVYNAELSVSKDFGKTLFAEVTGYATFIDNFITTAPGTFNGQSQLVFDDSLSQVVTSVNATQGRILGTNAIVKANLSQRIDLFGTINYTYGRVTQADSLVPQDHIPPLFGRLGVLYTATKLNVEAFTLFNGAKRLQDYSPSGEDNIEYATPNGMPGWYTLNLRARYQINRYVSLQASVDNILDTNYRVFSSSISAPGRNVSLTLRLSY